MAINIQNLLNVVQAKLNATTPTTPALEFSRLSSVSDMLDDLGAAVKSYTNLAAFPTADSANHGDIAYSLDSGAYRISEQLAWREISLNADSVITATVPYTFQGDTKAYVYGGAGNPPQSPTTVSNDLIDAFPFASDTNATDTANLIGANQKLSGVSSATAGYDWTGLANPAPPNISGRHATFGIDKFVFASETDATSVSNSIGEYGVHNAASASDISAGYTFGGARWSYPGSGTTFASPLVKPLNTVLKLTYASDTSGAADHGDLSFSQSSMAGLSSPTEGKAYTAAGTPGGHSDTPHVGTVREIPFASGTSVTVRSNGVTAYGGRTGISSPTDGYVAGGRKTSGPPYSTNEIDKFPFASDTAKSDQGDLVVAGYGKVGNSSSSNGYVSGGTVVDSPTPPTAGVYDDTIQKFPFASATNATDIGNLSRGAYNAGGWQN